MKTTQNQTNMDEKIRQLALESFSLGFKAGYNAALGRLKDEKGIDSQIEINGVLWDTENLEINGQVYFTHDEALKAAASVGKRLPTEKEYKALLSLGWEWDEVGRGLWVANHKLFFPAAGYRDYSTDAGFSRGSFGYYWSSEVSGTRSSLLYFYSSSASMSTSNRAHGLSVRCVQDVEKKLSELKQKVA